MRILYILTIIIEFLWYTNCLNCFQNCQDNVQHCVHVFNFSHNKCVVKEEKWECPSISTAFEEVPLNDTCIVLYGSHQLSMLNIQTNVNNFKIIGNISATKISCSDGAGFSFRHSQSLNFGNLNLINCGTIVDTFVYSSKSKKPLPAKISSAFYFDHTNTIRFNNVNIMSSIGYGIFMSDCIGDIAFTNIRMFGNTLKKLSEYTSGGGIVFLHLAMDIELTASIKFERGTMIQYMKSHTDDVTMKPFGHGGAVSLLFLGNSKRNQVSFIASSMAFNSAVGGGGLYLEHGSNSSNNNVSMLSVMLMENIANLSGGAIHYHTYDFPSDQMNELEMSLLSVLKNTARIGGGICQTKYQNLGNDLPASNAISTKLRGIRFANNKADLGAALYFENAYVGLALDFVLHHHLLIQDNNGLGAVYSYKGKIEIDGEVDVLSSNDTAIVLHNSLLHLNKGSCLFVRGNHGVDGGGIALYEQSFIYVSNHSFINFRENTASRGAAIFLDEDSRLYRIANTSNQLLKYSCFFQFEAGAGRTNFTQNFAVDNQGNAIYATTLKHCQYLINCSRYLSFDTGVESIKTLPVKFGPVYATSTSVYPGETVHINVTLTDEYENEAHTSVRLHVEPKNITVDEYYKRITSNLMAVTFYGAENTQFSLKIFPLRGTAKAVVLKFYMTKCKFGYEYKGARCQCSYTNGYITECDPEKDQVFTKKDLWVKGKVITKCPRGYCQCHSSNESGIIRPDCLYTADGLRLQCRGNRDQNSTLCGRCKPGYSITFGGETCRRCNENYNLIWIIPCLLLAVGFVILILLKLNVDVYKSYLNSFFFFYQIAGLSMNGSDICPAIRTIVGAINLSGLHFGDAYGLCITENFTDLDKNMLNYLFPLSAFIVLLVMTKFPRFNQENCHHAMVFIIFWSYADVTRVSFAILQPASIKGVKDMRVFCDGESRYFVSTKHFIYGAFAGIMMIMVILLPVCLLFSGFLIRCFPKLIPIFDCFKSCFKDDIWSQTYASHYFMWRFVFNVINLWEIDPLELPPTFACLTVIILFIFIVSKPYKTGEPNGLDDFHHLNYYETVILTILTAVAILINGRQKLPRRLHSIVDTWINVLLWLPSFWVFGNIFYNGYKYAMKSCTGKGNDGEDTCRTLPCLKRKRTQDADEDNDDLNERFLS